MNVSAWLLTDFKVRTCRVFPARSVALKLTKEITQSPCGVRTKALTNKLFF